VADTYTLADLMREREERTPTLGGPPSLPGIRIGTEPPLAQHNLIDRTLSSFGRPTLEAVQAAQRGEATPRDVAWSFLTEGPMGPLGSVRIPNPIRAYHGSPHTFDEFRMDRIGTGEGAQAYGHGLYFAENPGVARQYRDDLTRSGAGNPYVGGRPLERSYTGDYAHGLAFDDLMQSGGNIEAAVERVHGTRGRRDDKTLVERMVSILRDWERQGVEMRPGSMYEVNLHARPEQFLDWDRPLSRQPETIRNAIPSEWLWHVDDAERAGHLPVSVMTGLKEPTVGEALREAGIPGIRYLDQGSRGAGEGTRNYVVFNPEIIEILRRYGIVAPPTGAALAAGLSDQGGP
jgi:hypothetical protein